MPLPHWPRTAFLLDVREPPETASEEGPKALNIRALVNFLATGDLRDIHVYCRSGQCFYIATPVSSALAAHCRGYTSLQPLGKLALALEDWLGRKR